MRGGGQAVLAAVLAFASPVAAQDLVYTPINPTFGGNAFNSGHLLGVAGAQNEFRDPNAVRPGQTPAQLFSNQLQARLLSALATQVTEAIFGENPQERGTITFGGQTIVFVRGLESVQLTITETATGQVTNIEIPTFLSVG